MSDEIIDVEQTVFNSNYGMIEPWFPTLIYFKDNLHKDQLDLWADLIKKILEPMPEVYSAALPVKSNHNTFKSDLTNYKEFDPLWDTILDHGKFFAQALGYANFTLSMTNCWANISRQGDYLFPHKHPGSLISGAFYIKASNTDQILFQPDETVFLVPNNPNYMTHNRVNYNCIPGRLLLFRSDTLHGVTRQESPEEKIVVSFNLQGNFT